jgi:hypothetical protein
MHNRMIAISKFTEQSASQPMKVVALITVRGVKKLKLFPFYRVRRILPSSLPDLARHRQIDGDVMFWRDG